MPSGGLRTTSWQPGETGNPGGRPPKPGRYSKALTDAQRERYRAHMEDPDAWDLVDELAILRMQLEEVLGGPHIWLDEDEDVAGLPVKATVRLIDAIGRTILRIHQMVNADKLTAAHVRLLQVALIDLIDRYVHEPEAREQFLAQLEATLGARRVGPPGAR